MAAVAVTPSQRMPRDLPLADVVDRCHAATPALQQALSAFWGRPAQVRLLSVGDRNLYFWRADDFFVTQLALGEAPEDVAQLRLCETGGQMLLDKALGVRKRDNGGSAAFSLESLSPLESQILTSFGKRAFNVLRPMVVRRKRSRRLAPGWLHACWTFRMSAGPQALADEPIGKIILTLPRQSFRLEPREARRADGDAPLDDAFFFHLRQPARVWVGCARLSLQDLEQIETGDLLLLDHSRLDRWAYCDPVSGKRFPFGVQLPAASGLARYNAQESRVMESSQPPVYEGPRVSRAREQLWSNLPIEVHAEFAPVRLPLRQVKQMTEGLIVEVGDLTANRIRLHVEGKTVATGELVIVGDRFGVRISRVGDDAEEIAPAEGVVHLPALASAAPSPQASAPSPTPSASAPDPAASAASEGDAFDDWVESDDSWINDDDGFDDDDP